MGVDGSPQGAVPCQAVEGTRTNLVRLMCPGSRACSIWVARASLQAWGSLEQGLHIPRLGWEKTLSSVLHQVGRHLKMFQFIQLRGITPAWLGPVTPKGPQENSANKEVLVLSDQFPGTHIKWGAENGLHRESSDFHTHTIAYTQRK